MSTCIRAGLLNVELARNISHDPCQVKQCHASPCIYFFLHDSLLHSERLAGAKSSVLCLLFACKLRGGSLLAQNSIHTGCYIMICQVCQFLISTIVEKTGV